MALEMKDGCLSCGKHLATDGSDVFICSYECTFCADCTEDKHKHVCPNCGGNLVIRPSRQLNHGTSN